MRESIMNKILIITLGFILVFSTIAFAKSGSSPEKECFNQIQGKVARDHKGNKKWDRKELLNFCRGTFKPSEPKKCFSMVMAGKVRRKEGGQWEPVNARRLCQGTSDARHTIDCFLWAVKKGKPFKTAISGCQFKKPGSRRNASRSKPIPNKTLDACSQYIQKNISKVRGNKLTWNNKELSRLCSGANRYEEPGNCIKFVMSEKVELRKGNRKWQKKHAMNLCQGTSNSRKRISCFTTNRKKGMAWQKAIQFCQKRS